MFKNFLEMFTVTIYRHRSIEYYGMETFFHQISVNYGKIVATVTIKILIMIITVFLIE